MKGVVMLVNEFSPLPVGGAERQAERLSAHLAKHGWPVWVLTRRAPGLAASESRFGFKIIRPPAWGPGKLQTISFVLGAMVELWRLRKDYGILHAHLAFGPAFAAVLSARLLGKRVVVKLGNSGEFGDIQVSQKTWRGRLRLSVFRRWADVVIVLDEAMQYEALSAGFNSKCIRRMSNGINAKAFTTSNSRQDAQSALGLAGKVVVLSMGRLAAQKSLPVLFRSFAGALPGCPDLHLLILGDGLGRAALEEMAKSLNISGHVTFAGNQADVKPYLNAADLFVLPSASEGISNALLEAMSAGLACLATPVGGNTEVLDDGRCGMLLPVGDVRAWSEALIGLGQSAQTREHLGKAAQERIRSEYDFGVVGERYESLYAELLGNKRSAVNALADAKR
jgi:glycosyltransferase involved in cell wall biosynthesis